MNQVAIGRTLDMLCTQSTTLSDRRYGHRKVLFQFSVAQLYSFVNSYEAQNMYADHFATWAASCEIVPSKMRRFRPSCVCAKYHPYLCYPFILRSPHVLEDKLSLGVAHFSICEQQMNLYK